MKTIIQKIVDLYEKLPTETFQEGKVTLMIPIDLKEEFNKEYENTISFKSWTYPTELPVMFKGCEIRFWEYPEIKFIVIK